MQEEQEKQEEKQAIINDQENQEGEPSPSPQKQPEQQPIQQQSDQQYYQPPPPNAFFGQQLEQGLTTKDIGMNFPLQQRSQREIFQDAENTAIQNVRIDEKQVYFRHTFHIKSPWWGLYEEYSQFEIDGLGKIKIGYTMNRYGYIYTSTRTRYTTTGEGWDFHYYYEPDYIANAQGSNVQMEYWNNGQGIIRSNNIPVVEFTTTRPNYHDYLYGHCRSGYPKLIMTFPFCKGRGPLYLYPDPSPCPESCLSSCACFAVFGTCTKTRNLRVSGLSQGTCTIVNSRVYTEACAKVFLCQGDLCYPHVDYPEFQVFFRDVLPIERLAIIMGLVHYSYFKKWYVIVQIRYSVMGMA